MKTQAILILFSGFSATALAAAAIQWQQCGGKGWTGVTTCASGLKCYCQSEYYSQCLATDPEWTGCSGTSTPPPSSTPLTSDSAAASPKSSNPQSPKKAVAAVADSKAASTTPASDPITPGTCAAYTGSKSGYATTTHYFDGQSGACGCSTGTSMSAWQASPGGTTLYTAAGSQSLFDGAGSSSWCGSGCGKCFQLTNVGAIAASGQGDCTGAGETITVMVTNLCPANGNAQWCSQPSNQYEYGAHFDIMSQGGPQGWNNPVVKYEEVACPGSMASNWKTCQCASGGSSRVRRGLMGL